MNLKLLAGMIMFIITFITATFFFDDQSLIAGMVLVLGWTLFILKTIKIKPGEPDGN